MDLTQVRRAAGRALWRTVAGGPDGPPWRPAWWRGSGRQIAALAGIALLGVVLLLIFGWHRLSAESYLFGGSWLVGMAIMIGLLALMLWRPLLAWRLGWLVVLYELTFAGAGAYLIDFPPLLLSGFQLVALLAVLLVVAASQPLPVVAWIWGLTSGLAWLAPLNLGLQMQLMLIKTVGSGGLSGRPPEIGLGFSGGPWAVPVQLALVALVTLVVAVGQLAGRQVRGRRELVEARTHGLVLAERARIARELHDVVAHHLSMIAVRAETAPYRLVEVAPSARAEFAQLSQDSRGALTELRRLLGVLRSEDSPSPTAPQPSLTDLADLIEPVQAAGTQVTLEMQGATSGLPAAVDLCAYRIVQEALTNARRHAAGAPVRISLRCTEAELMVRVVNAPAADPPPLPGADGHGLRGMRERVALLGGVLRAGPTEAGGYEVEVVLPIAAGAVPGAGK